MNVRDSTERDFAIALANQILNLRYEDSDSDRAILARQFLREVESSDTACHAVAILARCRDELQAQVAELRGALRNLATVPAVLQVLGRKHAGNCTCPLCDANKLWQKPKSPHQQGTSK